VFNIVERRYWFFLLSALVVVPGLISLVMFRVPLSIDFRGGAIYQVQFKDPGKPVTEDGVRQVYTDNGIGDVHVVEATDPNSGAIRQLIRSEAISPAQKATLEAALTKAFGAYDELQFDSVGPSVGSEVTRKAAIAVILAAVAIMVYLTVVFASVPHPLRYGVAAVLAMIHDTLVVVGLASIVGRVLGWEVDALFLTALLTVLAFSVHDTIVVFDRIRENVTRLRGVAFDSVVNHSIVQTLDRSINTQLTALFALVSILVYSQGQLKHFVFWLIIGLISGTYSSIFNAAAILVVWANRDWRYWFGRGRDASSPAVG
jgi:preprotein translocase subunit SecF